MGKGVQLQAWSLFLKYNLLFATMTPFWTITGAEALAKENVRGIVYHRNTSSDRHVGYSHNSSDDQSDETRSVRRGCRSFFCYCLVTRGHSEKHSEGQVHATCVSALLPFYAAIIRLMEIHALAFILPIISNSEIFFRSPQVKSLPSEGSRS